MGRKKSASKNKRFLTNNDDFDIDLSRKIMIGGALVTAGAIVAMALLHFLLPAALSLAVMIVVVAVPLVMTAFPSFLYFSSKHDQASAKKIASVVVARSAASHRPKQPPLTTRGPERIPNHRTEDEALSTIEESDEEDEEDEEERRSLTPTA